MSGLEASRKAYYAEVRHAPEDKDTVESERTLAKHELTVEIFKEIDIRKQTFATFSKERCDRDRRFLQIQQ